MRKAQRNKIMAFVLAIVMMFSTVVPMAIHAAEDSQGNYVSGFSAAPTYLFDFSTAPTVGAQAWPSVSAIPGVTRAVSPTAGQPGFDLIPTGNFRIQAHSGSNFIDPNGANRQLNSNVSLSGPIHVVIYARATGSVAPTTLPLTFAGQTITFDVPNAITRIEHTFLTGEGLLSINPWNWGVDGQSPGRLAVQRIEITEVTQPSSSIQISGVDGAHSFPALPYGYTAADITPLQIIVTNPGDAAIINLEVALDEGTYFTLEGTVLIPSLSPNASAEFSVRPNLGLEPDQTFADTVRITNNDDIYESFTVSVVTLPNLPVDAGQPPAGATPVSTENQFPHNMYEVISWDNNFRRVSITAGNPQMLINRQLRDVDANLATPFVFGGILQVPLSAAQAALGSEVSWQVSGNNVTATAGADSHTVASISISVAGTNVLFVPLQTIAQAIGVGTIGWDNIGTRVAPASYTLVITTGAVVTPANISRGGITNQAPQWYGSPNSIIIATHYLYAQRFNGGFPRGIGQGDANQAWGSANIAGWTQANLNTMWNTRNNLDAYLGRGITTHDTRFLMMMYEATGIERFRDAGLRGLDALLNAQYQVGDVVILARQGQVLSSATGPPFPMPYDIIATVGEGRGGWPYYLSNTEMHRGGVSFNDDAYTYVLELLLDIAEGDFPSLDAERTERSIQAFVDGLDAVLRLQIRASGFADGVERPTAWAQHFNPETGLPMWGREFEPPAIVGGEESRDLFAFLTELDLDDIYELGGADLRDRLIDAIHYAAFWFAYVEVVGYQHVGQTIVRNPAASLWARFHCPETFLPLFSDRRQPNAGATNDPFGLWGPYAVHFANNPPAGHIRSIYRCDHDGCCVTRTTIDGGQFCLNPSHGPIDLPLSFANVSLERRQGYGYIRATSGVIVARDYANWLARNNIFVNVITIADVTPEVVIGVPTPIAGRVLPAAATYSNIVWTVYNPGTTGATIQNGMLHTAAGGQVVVRATIANGLGIGVPFVMDFTINVVEHIPVESVIAVPNFLPIGSFNLSRVQVVPAAAANPADILWDVVNAGTTGAVMVGSNLTTTAAGNVTVKAAIAGGIAPEEDFVQEITIRIDPDPLAPVPVASPETAFISDFYVLSRLHNVQNSGHYNWEYMRNFQLGNDVYGDRPFGANFSVYYAHEMLLGLDWIRTAQDARNQTANMRTQAMFTLTRDVYVVVAFEQRVNRNLVHWIDDTWQFLGDDVYFRSTEAANQNPFYFLYARAFEAGEVFRLGGLNQGTGLGQAVVFFIPIEDVRETPPYQGDTAGTWYETAWATWTGSTAGNYSAFVRLRPGYNAYYWRTNQPIADPAWDMARGWVKVDTELVRLVDPVRNTWRVDIQGLPRGTYDVEIRNCDGTVIREIGKLQTTSFHRYGAAFIPSNELVGNSATTAWAPYGATGGYLSDGRIHPNAIVMYVSHNNWNDFTIANLGIDSIFRNGRPMVVRFIGTVGTFAWNFADAQIPPSVAAGNRMMTLQSNSAHRLTIEGVGHDAAIYGWGLFTNGAVNVVLRNLHVNGFFQQGFRASGNTTNFWVHNNTFHYGQNRFFHNDEETDRTMGQGSVDIEQNVRGYTISFNHFNGGRGTNLIVGSVQNWNLDNNGHRHYGTLHHNIYDSAQERNPRTRHHNLHMFNNLFRDVLGHPLHYRISDRYTGYGIGAAHNATIWAEGNIFDDVGFPFLRSRHGHARGYYPHTGHNHFWPDGPGFIVTGDNVDFSGTSVGRMPLPAFGDWGYRNTVRGLNTQADFDAFAARVNNLQPNVMCSGSASTFSPSLDVGITVDQAATMMMPPAGDVLYGVPGFPALNANANTHGWGFEGDFIPSTTCGVWPTGTPEEVAVLRAYIEANAGVMPAFIPSAPVTPPTVANVSVNELNYFMHRHGSPTPSLRTIEYAGTFTINWYSNDVLAQSYEIQFMENGMWRTLDIVTPRTRTAVPQPNTFITQDMSDFGYLIMEGGGHDWVAVHLGGNGHVVMYPNLLIGHPSSPIYTEADIPTPGQLRFTAPWVIANLENGGIYQFRIRAANSTGTSDWTEFSYVVAPNTARIISIAQVTEITETDGVIAPTDVVFTVETAGIADGTYDISLSVPRSMARNVFPWPAQRNLSGDVFLQGAATFPPVTGPLATTGNGGTGQLVVTGGIGTITVVVAANIPIGPHDLVLTVNVNGNTVSLPFSIGLHKNVCVPVLSFDIFNNGEGGSPSRPNPSLAAAGIIRMWTQLDGVNTPVYLVAADTIVALDQDGECAEEFVRVGRVWQDGTGWLDYFNLVDVNKNGAWQYINFYITVYGQTVHLLLVNANYTPQPPPE
ncbi:MAG: hypothetical protein FWC32_06565, partial [Firmicutes bacterium]|nr:hypothetical protein [Bacillota bacterium]